MWKVTEQAHKAIYEVMTARRAFMAEMEDRLREAEFSENQITRFTVAIIYLNDCVNFMLERDYADNTLSDLTMLTYYMDDDFREMVRVLRGQMIQEKEGEEE